jgi:hypothetical protein
MRRIGVLMGLVASDPEAQSRVAAFENGLRAANYSPTNFRAAASSGLSESEPAVSARSFS